MALTLTNAQIVARFKTLANQHYKAESGSITTAVNKNLDSRDYTNYFICFVNGANFGEDRIITAHDTNTGTLTFDDVLVAVANRTEFAIVETGFLSDIKQAEIFLTNYLRNKNLDINLFLNSAHLQEAHIYKTLELICLDRMQDGTDDDKYFIAYNKYKELFEIELSKLVADYDANEDGVISEDEEITKVGQVRFRR